MDHGAFPDDSIHVALRKHGKKKKNTAAYAGEYVPRAPHPLMQNNGDTFKENVPETTDTDPVGVDDKSGNGATDITT